MNSSPARATIVSSATVETRAAPCRVNSPFEYRRPALSAITRWKPQFAQDRNSASGFMTDEKYRVSLRLRIEFPSEE